MRMVQRLHMFGRPPIQVFIEDLSQMPLQEVEQIDSWATSY